MLKSAKKIMVQLTHSEENKKYQDPYGTVRNASKTVDAWRNNLSSEEMSLVKQIEEVCKEMMKVFEYEPV